VRTVHHLADDTELVVEYISELGWYCKFKGQVHILCLNEVSHDLDLDIQRAITPRTDPILLSAYEGAIRGWTHCVMQLLQLLVDDELSLFDPTQCDYCGIDAN
jgi:hypothetical protein